MQLRFLVFVKWLLSIAYCAYFNLDLKYLNVLSENIVFGKLQGFCGICLNIQIIIMIFLTTRYIDRCVIAFFFFNTSTALVSVQGDAAECFEKILSLTSPEASQVKTAV